MIGAMGSPMERTIGPKKIKNRCFMEKMHEMGKDCWLSPLRNWIIWEGVIIIYFDLQELIEGIRSHPLGCSKCAIRGQNCDFNRNCTISARACPSDHPLVRTQHVRLSNHLSVHPSICQSVHLSVRPFVCPSICPSIHLSLFFLQRIRYSFQCFFNNPT